MKKKHLFRIVLAFVLVAAMLLPFVSIAPVVQVEAADATVNNFDVGDDFKGLKLSVIGDSISTYYGVTNNKTNNPLYLVNSEATFGTYYGNTSHSDYAQFSQVKRADTWWQQAVDIMGMDLLVNNAWSGSYVLKDTAQGNTTEYPAAGYKDRSVNLHNGSTKPDIIAVYLGTNDVANYSSTNIGSKADVDTASERNALYTSVNSYKTPTTSVQAYYIMLSRMIATYPDAEIYCLTPTICLNAMPAARTTALNNFNAGVKYLVDYFAGQGKKIYLVDLGANTGLVDNTTVKDYYYANNVHPDTMGLDWITNCFLSELLKNSSKDKGTATIHEVSYNLSESYVDVGLVRTAVEGKPFSVTLLPYEDYQDVELTVTMGGKDVTAAATHGDIVYIQEVTGDIVITAKADKGNTYAWDTTANGLISLYGDGYDYNNAKKVAGTYTYNSSSEMAAFTNAYYKLEETVILQHDKPWELEFMGGGGTFASGIMLFNGGELSSAEGNQYIHITQTQVFFGYRSDSAYRNSGILWTTIAEKLGSEAGADIRKELHTFRFVNEPNGTNNKIRLYVDDVDCGTMDQTITNSSNISGQDFVFNYMGSSEHFLRNCSIDYINVWETGSTTTKTEFNNYLWELTDKKDDFVSVDDRDIFTENYLTKLKGSVEDGTFSNAIFELEKPVVLMHNKPWSIEWKCDGSTSGTMLLATSNDGHAQDAPFLYKRQNNALVAIGAYDNIDVAHYNYGYSLKNVSLDPSEKYTYRLTNIVDEETDTNMVCLYIDDEYIGALTDRFSGGNDLNSSSDWISGKDFVFSYIGVESFELDACNLDYIQVWEEGYIAANLDTLRLRQLLEEYNDIKPLMEQYLLDSGALSMENNKLYADGKEFSSDYSGTNFQLQRYAAYMKAIEDARSFSDDITITQEKCDAYVDAIEAARFWLHIDNGDGRMLSAELVTGESVSAGKQIGLRIITGAFADQIRIRKDSEKHDTTKNLPLTFSSCKLQYMEINGEEMLVKVWLVGLDPVDAPVEDYTLHIGARNYTYNDASSYWQAVTFDVI